MNHHQPYISIIIPTYNRLTYTKIALESALQQRYTDYEIIVTDDSTNDEIKDYIAGLNNAVIKYFKNEVRLGIAMNVKHGLAKASGTYFTFLNDDDFWDASFLEELVLPTFKFPETVLMFSDHWLVDSFGNVLLEDSYKNSISYKRNLYETGVIGTQDYAAIFTNFTVPAAMASLWKRAALDLADFPVEVGGAYDRWLLIQYIKLKMVAIYYINKRLTYYRIHAGSVSANSSFETALSSIFILERPVEMFRFKPNDQKFIKKELKGYCRQLIKHNIVQRNPKLIVRYLLYYARISFNVE